MFTVKTGIAETRLSSICLVAISLFLIFMASSAQAVLVDDSSTGPYAYITNQYDNTVSVINTVTNTVTATIPVGNTPIGIAINPAGTRAFVANSVSGNVSV